MPKPPLLPRLIRLVKPEERKKYEKWIEMNTVDSNTVHIQWFKTLFQKLEAMDFPEKVERASMISWWEDRFPEQSPAGRKVDGINQLLCRYTEDFFAYQLQEIYPNRKLVDLVFALLKRDGSSLFVKYYNRELKRFRNRLGLRVDFRYWLNYSQLLFIGKNWDTDNVGTKKVRGTKPFSEQELSSTLDETVVFYSLERGLFKLATENIKFSPIELHFLKEAHKDPTKTSPQIKAILTAHEWCNNPEIPDIKQVEVAVEHLIKMSVFSGKDLSQTLLALYYNVLNEWQKKSSRPELRMQNVKIYQAFLSNNSSQFSESEFLALLKLYCEVISSLQHRISIRPSARRQKTVGSYIHSTYSDLQEFIKNQQETKREYSMQVMDIYLAFESEDNHKLTSLLLVWAQNPMMHPFYEAGIRWVKAKYLFLLGDEEALFDHTRALDSFLQTQIQKEYSFQYFSALKVSSQFLRKISNSFQKEKSLNSLTQQLQKVELIEDRDWLLAQLIAKQK